MGQCYLAGTGSLTPLGGRVYGHLEFPSTGHLMFKNKEDYYIAEKFRIIGADKVEYKSTIGLGVEHGAATCLELFKLDAAKPNQKWTSRFELHDTLLQFNCHPVLNNAQNDDVTDRLRMGFWRSYNQDRPKMTMALYRTLTEKDKQTTYCYNAVDLAGDDSKEKRNNPFFHSFAFHGSLSSYRYNDIFGTLNPHLNLVAGDVLDNGYRGNGKSLTTIYKNAGYDNNNKYFDNGTLIRDYNTTTDNGGYYEIVLSQQAKALNFQIYDGTTKKLSTYPIAHKGNFNDFFMDYLKNIDKSSLQILKNILHPTGTYNGTGGAQTIIATTYPKDENYPGSSSLNSLTGAEKVIFIYTISGTYKYIGFVTMAGGIVANVNSYSNSSSSLPTSYVTFSNGQLIFGYNNNLNNKGYVYGYVVL